MKIGIIDADLISRRKHRFPNLACEKISGYWKDQGASVDLLLNYDFPDNYDQIYVSKVFTDTPVPDFVNELKEKKIFERRIQIGGTGFYFDKAPNLPTEIEHHMPDYNLYDIWIKTEVLKAKTEEGELFSETSFMKQFKEYTDYSIGFMTRGCFRKCEFCVNKKYDHVFRHSGLCEFYDPSRKKICLLDDNFLGLPEWRELLEDLMQTGKQFKFKQGLDERLLTEEKCKLLFSVKYDGDYTFAFDNVADYDLINKKLEIIRKYSTSTSIKFYVLVGFESTDGKDIENAFKRLELLMRYKCLPYIMRYQDEKFSPWKESKYRGMYISLARWGNQPSIYKKMSFRQFCKANQDLHKTEDTLCSAMEALTLFEKEYPCVAEKYFDLRYEEF